MFATEAHSVALFEKFAVGAKTDQFENGRVEFAIDEDEVWANVAIAKADPFAT